jgi:hypothetical protein
MTMVCGCKVTLDKDVEYLLDADMCLTCAIYHDECHKASVAEREMARAAARLAS